MSEETTPREAKSKLMKFKDWADRFLADRGHGKDPTRPTLRWWKDYLWLWEHSRWVKLSREDAVLLVLRWLMDHEIHSNSDVARIVFNALKGSLLSDEVARVPCWSPAVAPSVGFNWLNMKNWMVDPSRLAVGDVKGGRRQKTSRWFATASLPYDWDPDARWTIGIKFLEEMLPNDPESILLIQEFFGYWISGRTDFHAALMLIGEAATGKSTIIEVAKRMLGPENCSFLSLDAFGKQFGLDATIGKLLNISDEVGRIGGSTAAGLKWYVSGQTMTVDRKFLPHTTFEPSARLVIAANQMPKFTDVSSGVWRRLHIIPMDVEVPYENRNVNLINELTTGQLPAIFNWALEGLARLLQQGCFTVNPRGRAITNMARVMMQPHRDYVKECIEVADEGFLSNTQLIATYESWCLHNGIDQPITTLELKREVRRQYPTAQDGRRQDKTNRQQGIQGVQLVV